MKKTFINLLLGTTLLFMAGCEKSKDYKAEFERTNPNNALLKVIYASAYSLNPTVQLSVDDVRVSGLITGRTPFPGGGYNTTGSNFADYLSLTPGNKKFSIAIPKRNSNVDSVVLFTTQINLEKNKNYTLNISDTLTKTKALLVQDTIAKPLLNTTKYRFVNLIPNVAAVDLYYGTTLMASNVAYNTPGKVFSMNIPPVTTLSWAVKEYPSTALSASLATYASLNTVANQKQLTAFAMGYKGSTSATL
ncbi:MAG: DUF4397 domain-containing protein, partial [Sphingobacteriales bacterium]